MLSRKYNSRAAAKHAIRGLKSRVKGIKSYHSCCHNANCGKSKKKSNRRRNTAKNTRLQNVANARTEQSRRNSTTTQDMLSELDAIAATIPPRRGLNRTRNMQRREGVSDYGIQTNPSNMAGERVRNYTTETTVAGAGRVDQILSSMIFTS